ncbi:Vomeronasal type-1 receptor A8 [Sciurus carolinensis]|uniref:Vomeronasal type-1 receptor n=1 Tax=Sciurus carolinensis TaxID=30640 RepID=A0AA41MNB3_SCICA|nr:Vomeronasal type-1 receptor A8 [Sciurus carolinensis]
MKMNQHFHFTTIRNAFYPQAAIGISANTFLLCLHIAAVFVGCNPRLTDLPITHLALTHILMLLTMGLLASTDIWDMQELPGDFKCKVLIFLNRVMRGLSIYTTCVLSVLQAVTISPSSSWLASQGQEVQALLAKDQRHTQVQAQAKNQSATPAPVLVTAPDPAPTPKGAQVLVKGP